MNTQQGGKKGKGRTVRAGTGEPADEKQPEHDESRSDDSSQPEQARKNAAPLANSGHVWHRERGTATQAAESHRPESARARPLAEVTARKTEDWIAEASHELRLPIANLKLLIETLLDGGLDDRAIAVRMLNRAKTEVDRLHSLVVDLLAIEQVSSRKEVLCEWVKLRARAQDAAETLAKQAAEKGLDVEVDVPEQFAVYANAQQLDQVLLNLIENAIKFTPRGGRVSVRAGNKPGVFSIEDSGIGMAPHEIPKIFQRFYRIDRAQSKGSTGLGLSIVKHIVELHDAKINVVSSEGTGSTFTLSFPAPPAEHDALS